MAGPVLSAILNFQVVIIFLSRYTLEIVLMSISFLLLAIVPCGKPFRISHPMGREIEGVHQQSLNVWLFDALDQFLERFWPNCSRLRLAMAAASSRAFST